MLRMSGNWGEVKLREYQRNVAKSSFMAQICDDLMRKKEKKLRTEADVNLKPALMKLPETILTQSLSCVLVEG